MLVPRQWQPWSVLDTSGTWPVAAGSLHKGWSNSIIGTDWKNLNRQGAKSAKETPHGFTEIRFDSSYTIYLLV
jgi:hypothetical protein